MSNADDDTLTPWEYSGSFRILRYRNSGKALTLDQIVELLRGDEASETVLKRSTRESVVRRGDFVIKSFGRTNFLKRILGADSAGTKAFRAFSAACRLRKHGVGTPLPLAVAEELDNGIPAKNYLITEYIGDLRNFRDELNRIYAEVPDCEALMSLMRTVANACRAMHDAGIVHRDLGNQNIGLKKSAAGTWEVIFLDLDRVRLFPSGSVSEAMRGKDLARIDLPSDFVRVFREMYYMGYIPPSDFLRAEARERAAFTRHTALRPFRHPIREWRVRREQIRWRRENPDVKMIPRDRELWIWDERSTQAISAYVSKDRRKFRSAENILKIVVEFFIRGLSLRKNYKAVLIESFRQPTDFSGAIGMTLDVNLETWEMQLRFLAELETAANAKLPILLRVYHHKGRRHWSLVAEKARELHGRGNAVAIALVQDRAAVREPRSWAEMVLGIIERTQAFSDFYEVGHATNRGKWGVWDFSDYKKLLAPALEAKCSFPHIRLTGPACIDFDLHSLPGLLSGIPVGTFHALSQHLYVDRRGAPENFQGKFDLVAKCAVFRAIAKTYAFSEEKIIVSEVNWPLRETGVYCPVDSPSVLLGVWKDRPNTLPCTVQPPRVSEEAYAMFMCRYLLLAVASGHVSRVYWWRLAHRGFGLIDDADSANPRPRPAFFAMKKLLMQLAGAKFERRLENLPAGTFALEFSRSNGTRFNVHWTVDTFPEVTLE